MIGWSVPVMAIVAAPVIGEVDRAAIASRVVEFNAMMNDGRIADSLDFLPPRLIRSIAHRFGVPESEVKLLVGKQIADAVAGVRFLSFTMNMQAATVNTTPDRQRAYMLIPTESQIAIPDVGALRSQTSTLALQDEGQWYLIRIDSAQQVALLRAAYPEFTGVDFPSGSSTMIERPELTPP